jgi:hypothetical protein
VKKSHSCVLALTLLLLVAPMPVISKDVMKYRQGKMSYAIYGGSLGDPAPVKSNAKRIAFELKGSAAGEIFAAIGPDRVDACSSEADTRIRWRDDQKLVCMQSGAGNYSCYFGFDLMNGKSIGGSIC